MKITKETIGKKIWLVPTGNNIARNKTIPLAQAKEAVIINFARIKGEFMFNNSTSPQSFSLADYSDNEIKQGDNAGYVVYGSIDDVEKAKEASGIRNFLHTNHHLISDDDLLKIGSVLSI